MARTWWSNYSNNSNTEKPLSTMSSSVSKRNHIFSCLLLPNIIHALSDFVFRSFMKPQIKLKLSGHHRVSQMTRDHFHMFSSNSSLCTLKPSSNMVADSQGFISGFLLSFSFREFSVETSGNKVILNDKKS